VFTLAAHRTRRCGYLSGSGETTTARSNVLNCNERAGMRIGPLQHAASAYFPALSFLCDRQNRRETTLLCTLRAEKRHRRILKYGLMTRGLHGRSAPEALCLFDHQSLILARHFSCDVISTRGKSYPVGNLENAHRNVASRDKQQTSLEGEVDGRCRNRRRATARRR